MSKPIYHKYLPTISDGLKSGKSLSQIGRELAAENGWTDNSGITMVKRWAKRIGSEIGPVIIQSVTRETWSDEIPEGEQSELTSKRINGVKRLAVLSDIHLPYHDKDALVAAIKWIKEFNPDTILLNGDIMDFYPINRFSVSQRKPDLKYEFDTWRTFSAVLRAQFKNVNIYFKQGNHELRLRSYINKHAAALDGVVDFDTLMDFRKHGILHIADNKFIEVGKLKICHGHEVYSGAGAVNVAKVVFDKAMDNILCGHFHRTQEFTKKAIGGEIRGGWVNGCLQQLTVDYAPVNQWNHGFACIEFEKDGTFTMYNKKIINGRVM